MTTVCEDVPLTEPLRFLKSTVTSFNCSLGLGTQESTLNVDLVDDCDPAVVSVAGNFEPINNSVAIQVGCPVYFPDNPPAGMPFRFGGVLTNWTLQQNSSGKTYNVKVSDPRQLLENVIVVVDSCIIPPVNGLNYFNVYAKFEAAVANGDCTKFGTSRSNERGMPYSKVIQALLDIDPTIYSPTGYAYKVNFSSFPGVSAGRSVPDWYRVAGPTISLLQLLQDICDVLAYEFYVELTKFGADHIINIGLIDLSLPPGSFNGLYNTFNGVATDISYGQELRNEKTKMVLFGEQVHYLTRVTDFNFFFGEDFYPVENKLFPIIPYKKRNEPGAECGFWIKKRIESLNVSLNDPLPSNGPYELSELDIRSAMASYEMWLARAFDNNTPGSLKTALRTKWPNLAGDLNAKMNKVLTQHGVAAQRAVGDIVSDPNNKDKNRNDEKISEDLKKIHGFISNLGNTYYGKQFIVKLNEKICWYKDHDEEDIEIYYTDVPTQAGGWIDNGPVLGLNDPELGFFRQDDGRVVCFSRFNRDGAVGVDPAPPASGTSPDYPTSDYTP
jgi:hypothetical protein